MADDKSLLLALPDHCLLAVLQCCAAEDQRSLFSAARAHSRLHQAAMMALQSISVTMQNQQHAGDVLTFLNINGRHVRSIALRGRWEFVDIHLQMSFNLQLTSLAIDNAHVELHPAGMPGITGLTDLKKLRLQDCRLLGDAAKVLATAMWQLPVELEHLSLQCRSTREWLKHIRFPAHALQRLQQLTYLELEDIYVLEASPALQSLEGLTKLVDLRLSTIYGRSLKAGEASTWCPEVVAASMLAGMHHLTRLELCHSLKIEPRVLAGKTMLQHLSLHGYERFGTTADHETDLLSQLHRLHQLTHLDLGYSLWGHHDDQQEGPHAAAYAALTASSHLRYLDIKGCALSACTWQHMFPVGRHLPFLQELDISARQWQHMATAPEGSRLVSCCPGLQRLDMRSLPCNTELLVALQGLSGLHTLYLATDAVQDDEVAGATLQALCQLARLRDLHVCCPAIIHGGSLLHLTQLQQLTALLCNQENRPFACHHLTCKGPDDEPVWRQLLRLHLNHNDVAEEEPAAAALAQ